MTTFEKWGQIYDGNINLLIQGMSRTSFSFQREAAGHPAPFTPRGKQIPKLLLSQLKASQEMSSAPKWESLDQCFLFVFFFLLK